MTTLLEDTILEKELTITDDGEHDRFAHYYAKKDLEAAMFTGKPVKALCGKVDVPVRDFTKYPVCPTCKEIYDTLKDE